jgi:hypothetical protein
VAKALAETEYEKYRTVRLTREAQEPDDFDRYVKQLKDKNEGEA